MKITIEMSKKEVDALDKNINLLHSATDFVTESEDAEKLTGAIEFAIKILNKIKWNTLN